MDQTVDLASTKSNDVGPVFRPAPSSWSDDTDTVESSLHQLSPYIGKLKPQIAGEIVREYSKPGDIVVDPFCGSGTVPLEAARSGRVAFASDNNSYAYVLTKAKLQPPANEMVAVRDFERTYAASQLRPTPDLRSVPHWVRKFFHPQTLREALRFADECIARRDMFLLACFLGVLHHQRPGFLSYPSSHLVPYLRQRKFPPEEFPEMYEPRDIEPRMIAKIHRTYRHVGDAFDASTSIIRRSRVQNISLPDRVGAVITSPPYMNALDYRRDNRLRLWFIERDVANYSPEPTDKRETFRRMMRTLLTKARVSLKKRGHLVLVVGETITRKRMTSHPSTVVVDLAERLGGFRLVDAVVDNIPDVRRARRDCRGTKAEHILVFRKK
jgi:DNA modification methylase